MNKFFTAALTSVLALGATFANAQFTRNGSATNISTTARPNSFQLTPDATNQNGTVWSNNKIDLAANSFNLTFRANFGTKDGGADGLALVFHNSPNGVAALGTGTMGQYIGFQGISPSLNVEFDTYNNSATAGDIAADHISISKNGSTNAGNQLTTAVQASATNANIEDGADHTVAVSWDSNAETLSVYFNGTLRQTFTQDVVNTIFGGNSSVFWGFTASTGSMSNRHAVFQLNMALTPATKEISPLPVTLIQFNAAASAKGNLLTWATASEKNSSHVAVERSLNAKTWETLGNVKTNGNSSNRQDYAFTDAAAKGLVYYRLKMVDLDGTFEYSNLVQVLSGNLQQTTVTAFPNPVAQNQTLNLRFFAADRTTQLQISDMAGQILKTETANTLPGETTLPVNTAGLKKGLYLVQIASGTIVEKVKIQVN